MIPWSISTTVRNPERIRDFLRILNSRYYKKGEKLTAKEKASIVILEKMAKLDEEYKNYEKKYNIASYNDLEKKRLILFLRCYFIS